MWRFSYKIYDLLSQKKLARFLILSIFQSVEWTLSPVKQFLTTIYISCHHYCTFAIWGIFHCDCSSDLCHQIAFLLWQHVHFLFSCAMNASSQRGGFQDISRSSPPILVMVSLVIATGIQPL